MVWKCLNAEPDLEFAEFGERIMQNLDAAPEDSRLQFDVGRFLYFSGDYEGAVRYLRGAARNDPENGNTFTLLALALYRLHRDEESFQAIHRAQACQPQELMNYYIIVQLLLCGGAWDDARAVLDYLRRQGVPEDVFSLWFQGQLAEFEEKEKALGLYRAAAAEVEDGAYLPWASQLYFRMAVLTGGAPDAQGDVDACLNLLDQGLAHDPFDEDCLNYAGWLLQKTGRTEEAMELFRALEERPNHPLAVERNLAQLYYQNLEACAPEALARCETLISRCPKGEYYYYAGCCKLAMGDFEGAAEMFQREIEWNPGDVDGYNGLARVLEAQNRWEDALVQVDRALEVMEEQGECYPPLYAHRVLLLRRLNRWEDALETAEKAEQGPYRLQFDICLQFGKWETAQEVLEQWRRQQGQTPEWMLASGRLCQYRGELEQARRIMEQAEPLLPSEDVQDFWIAQADLTRDTPRLVELWRSQQQEHPDSSYYLIHLAFNQWQAGQKQAAEATAGQALERIDRDLQGYLTVEALYRARRVIALALAGKRAEAEEELARVRELPLCRHCEYCACKDADIFEAMTEEVCGSRGRALELYRRGAERWPDEMNFRAGVIRLDN